MELENIDPRQLSNDELYKRYAPAVYGSIYRMAPHVPMASKMLENVFKDAFRNRVDLHNSLRAPLTTLLNHSRNKTQQTLLALHIISECCAGTTIKRTADQTNF